MEFGTIDCETDPFRENRIPEPFLWCIYYRGRTELFYSTDKFIHRLRNIKAVFYAHNGGKFDFIFLQQFLNKNSKIKIVNGRVLEMKIGNATLRDSYAILPVPLSAYQKDNIDYNIFEKGERDKVHNKLKIEEYIETDCIYLHDFIKKFIENIGSKLTIASNA